MSKNLSCSYTKVGILSFISMIYTTSESFFSFYEQLKYVCSAKLSMKKVYYLEAWPRGYKTFLHSTQLSTNVSWSKMLKCKQSLAF